MSAQTSFHVSAAETALDAKLSRCYSALSHPVPPSLQVGSIVIQEGVLLPQGMQLDSDRYTIGWRAVRTINSFGVDHKIRGAGWNLFAIAGEMKTTVLGSGSHRVRRALIRVLANVRSLRFNSAEVTAIGSGRFLGIPYTTIAMRARHIQQGAILQGLRMRHQAQRDTDWARS